MIQLRTKTLNPNPKHEFLLHSILVKDTGKVYQGLD
jgi:hypothetical protein